MGNRIVKIKTSRGKTLYKIVNGRNQLIEINKILFYSTKSRAKKAFKNFKLNRTGS